MIETANAVLPDPRWDAGTFPSCSVPPGEYMVLSISDTGAGMDADTLARAAATGIDPRARLADNDGYGFSRHWAT